MNDFNDDHNCFVCGKGNPVGLRLVFRDEVQARSSEAEVVFPSYLQGWQDTVHGGLIATVLDEVMVHAATASGTKCVTAEITVKYRKPVATGVACSVSGKVLATRGRILEAESQLRDAAGQILAQARGKLFQVG